MKKIIALQIASLLFKNYPSVDEFHITEDEQAFENKHNAEAHASFLNKNEPVVITISRDDVASAKWNQVDEKTKGKAEDEPLSRGDEPEVTEEDSVDESASPKKRKSK